MVPPVIQEFATSLPADSGLLRASVSAGEPIDQAEVLSLASMAQSLFVTVTIESRALTRIADSHQLWGEAAQVFGELCASWAGIQSRDSQVRWLRSRLEHFRLLCEDRREIYDVSETDRVAFSRCRESEMRALAPPIPQPFNTRENAHIDAALNRRLTAAH